MFRCLRFVTFVAASNASSRISGTIKQSCASSFYLPNDKILDEQTAKQYLEFGLNEQQLAIIGQSIAKQDYYFTSVLGNRLIQLDLDPLTLSFIGVSKTKDMERFDETFDQDNPKWVLEWLKIRGLSSWADYANRCYLSDKKTQEVGHA